MAVAEVRWKVLTPSQFPWEREALDFVRGHLPDHDLIRAWANFEFIADDGSINEVDLLVLTPTGLFLIEIKSRPGTLEGDAHTWTWKDGERIVRTEDNPLLLANRKAKRLASLLGKQRAWNKLRLPYVEALVFCSAPGLACRLEGAVAARVHLRDSEPEGRAGGQPGIIAVLARPAFERSGDPQPPRIDLRIARALSQAMEQAGIRPSQRSRRVGDYILGRLLFEGPGYQDWEGAHAALENVRRRVRLYPIDVGASRADRESRRRAAAREFQILQGIQHPRILRAVEYTEHERGPALLFEHDPGAVRLDHFLLQHGARLGVDLRLGLVRQIVEAVRYAHEKRLFHRALSPQSILVLDPASATPRIQIFNWQTGTRQPGPASSLGRRVSGTSHIEELVEDAATVYMAPEALTDGGGPEESLDVFSLGAIAYYLFTDRPPAASVFELAEKIREGRGLRVSEALNGAGIQLQDLIQLSTHPEVTSRVASAEDFLALLDKVEEELTTPEPDEEKDPTEATANDRLRGGFIVKKRLGEGSCAVVLLVERGDEELILKVASDPKHNVRLRGEGEILTRLRHQHIVELFEVTEISGRVALVMRKAGEQTLAQRVRAEGRLHLDLLHRFGEDLIQTVDWLEQLGVSHRDIKPDNIGVGPVGRDDRLHLVLFDFSLSRTSPENILAGTVPYRDPFLSLRKPPRWDLYAERFAVAMTLHEMATGRLPRWGDGQSDPAVLTCEVTLEPELFDANLREGMTEFFAKTLRRDHRERFDNCEEMLGAWRRVFEAMDRPTGGADEREGRAPAASLDEVTLDTPVVVLGLSTRAINALDRLNIITVRDLLAESPVGIYRMPGVGHKTRREIAEAIRTLRQRFPRPVPKPAGTPPSPVAAEPGAEEAEPQVLSVDLLAQRLLPMPARGDRGDERALRLLLGLTEEDEPRSDSWRSQVEVADLLGLSRARIGQFLAAARARWSRDPSHTRLRQDIVDILVANGGVMSSGELSAAVLTARGSVADEPLRSRRAAAVTRAAIEVERSRAEPRFLMRRGRGVVLVARTPELADYAERLGREADRLAAMDPLASPVRALETLQRVPLPPGLTAPLSERLVKLAARASLGAAVSSRFEIYPRGMPALRALRLAHGALLGSNEFTVDEIRKRVTGRYPKAESLPDRPTLDALIQEAGWDFEWIQEAAGGKGAYRSPARAEITVSPGSPGGPVRLPTVTSGTGAPPAEITQEVADARQLEERLRYAVEHGAFLALTVEPRDLQRAEHELVQRFAVERRSLEEVLIRHMRKEASATGADWRVVLRADAAPRESSDWHHLMVLVRRAIPGVERELLATEVTILLTYPGLLARYDQLDLLERLRDQVGRPGAPRGCWVLIPSDAQHTGPVIDGEPVPVITRGQWARIPDAWLRNVHRAAWASSGPAPAGMPSPLLAER